MIHKTQNENKSDEIRDKSKTYINPDQTEIKAYIENEWISFIREDKITNKVNKLEKKIDKTLKKEEPCCRGCKKPLIDEDAHRWGFCFDCLGDEW